MTVQDVLDRIDYLYKYEGQIQPLIDDWEEKARKRYHTKIDHCSIKERGKRTVACLNDASPENQEKRMKLVNYWLRDFDVFNMVDHLLRHNGPEPWESWNYVDQIRVRLCFIAHYMPPIIRENLQEGQCRNTGKWTHEYYKNNKKIPGRKKEDLCPCSRCIKERWTRSQEIAEYRKYLSERKKTARAKYEEYKNKVKQRSKKSKSFKKWKTEDYTDPTFDEWRERRAEHGD
jgi:hypothetical protein